ncbi:hypothetical protein RI844_09445 [Thalassotalea fonticola]|uniref:Uncharacterized protein n=1 Tax=Thalassotalea fonticola TaxID=3065649 RepID=A0ABZ0GTZ4_9GAMM|nr:hypothetical protein RI844_09445 [Colwelliaceae bacterium S1-1]
MLAKELAHWWYPKTDEYFTQGQAMLLAMPFRHSHDSQVIDLKRNCFSKLICLEELGVGNLTLDGKAGLLICSSV